jgi:hypothetical protein
MTRAPIPAEITANKDAPPMSDPIPSELVERQDPASKAKRTLLGIEIPRDELALRIMMAAVGASPPAGMTAAQAIADADRLNPGMASTFRRQADAAVHYFHECVNAARQPS